MRKSDLMRRPKGLGGADDDEDIEVHRRAKAGQVESQRDHGRNHCIIADNNFRTKPRARDRMPELCSTK